MKILLFFFHSQRKTKHVPLQETCILGIEPLALGMFLPYSTHWAIPHISSPKRYSWHLALSSCGLFDLRSLFLLIATVFFFLSSIIFGAGSHLKESTAHVECAWEPLPFPTIPPSIQYALLLSPILGYWRSLCPGRWRERTIQKSIWLYI